MAFDADVDSRDNAIEKHSSFGDRRDEMIHKDHEFTSK